MKKIKVEPTGNFNVNESYEGVSLETTIQKMMADKEPITATSKTIFTEKKDGVIPDYDIRTDRFEIAYTMTDHISATAIAKRKGVPDTTTEGGESSQGTTE